MPKDKRQDQETAAQMYRHLYAQYALTRTLATSSSLKEAFPRLLQAIGEAEDWQLGEVWKVDHKAGKLRRLSSWQTSGAHFKKFESAGGKMSFRKGTGLLGKVWSSKQPHVIRDFSHDTSFQRASVAAEEGLHAAFAFPVQSRANVKFVLAFYSREIREPNTEVLKLLEELGRHIKEFLRLQRTRQAHRKSEIRLRAILQTIVDAIITIDDSGLIRSINPAATRIFGYTPEETIGKNVSILMPEPDRSLHDTYLSNYLRTGEAKIIGIGREVMARKKDGTIFPIYLSIGEMRLGQRRMFTAVIQDFTRLKRMQEEVLRARNLAVIGEMAASVAHEIKNPLAGIGGAVQVIRDRMPEEDPTRQIIDEVSSQIGRLDQTVRHLLMFSRPWEPEKQMCNLREFVDDITSGLKRQPVFSRLRFEWAGEAEPEVPLDPLLFEHLLVNVIRNAAQAMPEGGPVICSFHENSQSAIVKISDRGPGIPLEVQEKLFRPFFSTKAQGTGLGLAICKKIVEAHGGVISIASEPGEGTEVILSFPKSD